MDRSRAARLTALLEAAASGEAPDAAPALLLADCEDIEGLMAVAAGLRDAARGDVVTYSRKVFIPLTRLCRDICHYCTFAKSPRQLPSAYLSLAEVLDLAAQGAAAGCHEALFTLGEKPELRYQAAREWLAATGYRSTIEYLADAAREVVTAHGLLPHINAGCLSEAELALLRPVSASMGIMLESASERLCEPGMPHFGSPDKHPQARLDTLERAGRLNVPMTSGLLIGIGETRRERIESLLALRALHRRYGHLQEIIIQNFRAKPDTRMAGSSEPPLEELLWSIAVARIVFAGSTTAIQAPPNLSPGSLETIVGAGIDDWGGVSPVTPDHVNPEAPWPEVELLRRRTRAAGKQLEARLTIYPGYALEPGRWLDPAMRTPVLRLSDAEGYARSDGWCPGRPDAPPAETLGWLDGARRNLHVSADLTPVVRRAQRGETLSEDDIVRLFAARGEAFAYVCAAADALRAEVNGPVVSYVVNRNINYTNICGYRCKFCAFSKGRSHDDLRGSPYVLDLEEIVGRSVEAWERGATEVCLQGGIHPDYTGDTYLDICRSIRSALPGMHIHAFSPLEVTQGAATLGLPVAEFLVRLKEAGLNSLPGTAAEILDDEVREALCPDKIRTDAWLHVMESAHALGLRSTATIMFGHLDRPVHWARHLLRVRGLQSCTGGFTEFVPLPFVHMEAPVYRRGGARKGPTFREALLMHAVARLVLHPLIANIQGSWVKLGVEGLAAALSAGVNDAGGTLTNESISRAAGASHGQELRPDQMEALITRCGRIPRQRATLYGEVAPERLGARTVAAPARAQPA
jgi:FO synthase